MAWWPNTSTEPYIFAKNKSRQDDDDHLLPPWRRNEAQCSCHWHCRQPAKQLWKQSWQWPTACKPTANWRPSLPHKGQMVSNHHHQHPPQKTHEHSQLKHQKKESLQVAIEAMIIIVDGHLVLSVRVWKTYYKQMISGCFSSFPVSSGLLSVTTMFMIIRACHLDLSQNKRVSTRKITKKPLHFLSPKGITLPFCCIVIHRSKDHDHEYACPASVRRTYSRNKLAAESEVSLLSLECRMVGNVAFLPISFQHNILIQMLDNSRISVTNN